MTNNEKKLIFSQFIKLIIDSKNLVNLLSQGFTSDHKQKILNLLSSINLTLNEYYMNFDVCDECGHPVPIIPSSNQRDELLAFYDHYIELFELKTGETFDESIFQSPVVKLETVAPIVNEPKIKASSSLEKHAKQSKRPIHFKGTLVKVN
jgi:hypothetical protein